MIKHIYQLLFCCAISMALVSCKQTANNNVGTETTQTPVANGISGTETEMLTQITQLEAQLKENAENGLNPEKALATAQAYDKFAATYPQNPQTPELLFKSGEIYRTIRNFDKAIEVYQQIVDKFGTSTRAGSSLFLIAFTYENDLQKIDKAKEYYTQFINKFPNHEFTDDAKYSLENIGKSPEELVKEFEKKNANKSPEKK